MPSDLIKGSFKAIVKFLLNNDIKLRDYICFCIEYLIEMFHDRSKNGIIIKCSLLTWTM